MRRVVFLYIIFSITFVSFGLASKAEALDVQRFHPLTNHIGVATVYGSQSLPQGKLNLGGVVNFVKNPFEHGGIGDGRIDEIVDYFVTLNLLGAIGLTDWLSVHIDVPTYWLSDIEPLRATREQDATVGFGDIRLSAILQLRQRQKDGKQRFGMGFVPLITFPSGASSRFHGDVQVSVGGSLVVDRQLAKRHYFTVNLGARLRGREQIANLLIDDQVFAGAGYELRLMPDKDWYGFLEVNAETPFRAFLKEEVSSPMEGLVGFKTKLSNRHLVLMAGVGHALNNGYGAPDFRIFTGLTYLGKPPTPVIVKPAVVVEEKPVEKVAPQPPDPIVVVGKTKMIRTEPIYFDTAKASIKAISFPTIEHVVDVMIEHADIKKVVIEGHTDNQGAYYYNKDLSSRRAQSVYRYMVAKGIDPGRLEAVGYGPDRPIADNDTTEGRARNRRVDFVIIE